MFEVWSKEIEITCNPVTYPIFTLIECNMIFLLSYLAALFAFSWKLNENMAGYSGNKKLLLNLEQTENFSLKHYTFQLEKFYRTKNKSYFRSC